MVSDRSQRPGAIVFDGVGNAERFHRLSPNSQEVNAQLGWTARMSRAPLSENV